MDKKILLMILDGWGLTQKPEVSAIDQANTPFVDGLYKKYPHSTLITHGQDVGLPEGQMGNSEVGHMNIGAGRVVYQDIMRISKSIEDGSLSRDPKLKEAFDYAKQNNKKVHFMGLVSDGGVHSHIEHVKGLCSIAQEHNVPEVCVHAFTDGRDTDPKGGVGYIKDLEEHVNKTNSKIASVVGRYYAMDRDKRWERVKLAYDLLVKGEGRHARDLTAAMQESYDDGITDEFIKPIVRVDENDQPVGTIEEGDVVLCFNFRTDRGREITMALTQQDFPDYDMKKMDLYYMTMTTYDETFEGVRVLFEKDNLVNTMGEVLAKNGKKQIRIAETEKYPHVTFFFSGGREKEFEGEKRIMVSSPKVATYDLQPEMSAKEVRDKIIPELQQQSADFVCLNFANPDMVGHTGVFDAAVKACETVDQCAGAVTEAALENDYTIVVIADHGNSDYMVNDDGSPNTAHTKNLVPCIVVDKEFQGPVKDGKLGDLAPSMLKLMGIDVPEEMTGNFLV